jgi:hypothetical protein
MSDSSDFEWETALSNLDRLTDEALDDLLKRIVMIRKKRMTVPQVLEAAFE